MRKEQGFTVAVNDCEMYILFAVTMRH